MLNFKTCVKSLKDNKKKYYLTRTEINHIKTLSNNLHILMHRKSDILTFSVRCFSDINVFNTIYRYFEYVRHYFSVLEYGSEQSEHLMK